MGGRGSSSGGGGTIVTQEQQKAIDKIAKQTRDLKKEQYRIIGENGDVIGVAKGGAHEVGMSRGEKRDKVPGGVTIHNHPNGGTFSGDDFSDFGYRARAIYAAAPEGTYSLVNKRYGTPEATSGWVAMRDAYLAEVPQSMSLTDLRNQARQTSRYKRAMAQVDRISSRGMAAMRAGASQDELRRITRQMEEASERAGRILTEEMRNAEVRPAHEWLRANARKYGFEYSFSRRR